MTHYAVYDTCLELGETYSLPIHPHVAAVGGLFTKTGEKREKPIKGDEVFRPHLVCFRQWNRQHLISCS